MSQIIVEQQFHYTTKMTSYKHVPHAIYANRNAKLEIFFCLRQAAKLASLAKFSINLVPEVLFRANLNS